MLRKTYKSLITLVPCLIAATLSHGVTINLSGSDLLQSNGTSKASTGALGLLVAATEGASVFGTPTDGDSTAVGSTFGSEYLIVARFGLVADGVAFEAVNETLGAAPLTNWAEGDALAIYWFPGLTTATANFSTGDSFGSFTSADAINGGSAWVTPANTSTVSLNMVTVSAGGTTPNADGIADQSVSGIPEPSTYAAIAGVLMIGLAVMRRKRA